jgi:hypothetical protein
MAALFTVGCTLSVPDVVSRDGGGEVGTPESGLGPDVERRDAGREDGSMRGDSGHVRDTGTSKDAGPPCKTTVSGTVFDPAGALPLPNVTVFQPKGALEKFVDGVACDSCSSLSTPSFATTPSSVDGTFKLPIDIAAGTSNVHVAFQSGRWRREISLSSVTSCKDNPIPTGTARLPKDRTEGDIPKTAIAMGSVESLECLLVKMGVSSSEIQPYQTPTDLARFQTFTNGTGTMITTPLSLPMVPTLFDTALDEYTSILFPCDGGTGTGVSGTELASLVTWSNGGGRAFIDHLPGGTLIHGQAVATLWPATATGTWTSSVVPSAVPAQGKLLTGSPGPSGLEAWMALAAVGGTSTYGAPYFSVSVPRADVTSVDAVTATEWARGETMNAWSTDPAGSYTLTYSFDTQIGAKKACGRVVYNDMHAAATRGASGGAFPAACDTTTPLGEDEKALEYMILESTACIP